MTRTPFKSIATVVAVTLLLIVAPAVFWAAYTIDEETRTGTSQGFETGNSVTEVARVISGEPSKDTWPVIVCAIGSSRYREIEAIDLDHAEMSECRAVFLVQRREDLATNGIRLEFQDGKLASIYRYRRIFELP